MVWFTNALSIETVMPIVNWWSAAEASNWVKVVRDGNNYYVCNWWLLSNCNKNNASTWVKYEKWLNRSDKYYICSAKASSCDSINHNDIINQIQHEDTPGPGFYYDKQRRHAGTYQKNDP